MRAASAVLAISVSLFLGTQAAGQTPAPPPDNGAQAENSPSLDWDRDFDLILESRQGGAREEAKRQDRVEAAAKKLADLRKEEADLVARLEIFSGYVTGEEAFSEMLRLEVGSPERAKTVLNAKLDAVRSRIADAEIQMKRAKRGAR